MPAQTALDRLREQYRHPDRAARAWKAGGGKVVGYLCDNVPTELIEAAGFLPVRVSGDPAGSVEAVRRYVDGLFQPTRRVGFAESMLARLLDGTYEYLDYLIVPHNRHAIQAIYQELLRAGATYPELRLPDLHLLDKSWLPSYASEAFNRDRLLDLHRTLEGWAGRPISDAALSAAIAASNEHRALLAQVAALRRPTRPGSPESMRCTSSARRRRCPGRSTRRCSAPCWTGPTRSPPARAARVRRREPPRQPGTLRDRRGVRRHGGRRGSLLG